MHGICMQCPVRYKAHMKDQLQKNKTSRPARDLFQHTHSLCLDTHRSITWRQEGPRFFPRTEKHISGTQDTRQNTYDKQSNREHIFKVSTRSLPRNSVHGYAQVHASIYIYIYKMTSARQAAPWHLAPNSPCSLTCRRILS